MTRPILTAFLGAFALATGAGGLAHAQPIERGGTSVLAQAQPNEHDKNKQHKEEKKGPPPERKGPPSGPPGKAMVPPTGPSGSPPGTPPAKSVIVPPDKGVPTQKVPPGPPAKAMVPPTGPSASPPGPPPAKSVVVPPDKGPAPTQKFPSSAQPLPPNLQAEFEFSTGRGYLALGHFEEASTWLEMAAETANAHGLHQTAFEAESELVSARAARRRGTSSAPGRGRRR